MNRERVEQILSDVAAGRLSPTDAADQLSATEPMDFATLDHDRHRRCGTAEVIYAAGKTPEQVVRIAHRLLDRDDHVLVTRAGADHVDAIRSDFTRLLTGARGTTFLIGTPPRETGTPIPIVTAGTSDETVAEEAMLTCRAMGQRTVRINDIGVAGLHRLADRLNDLRGAGVIICIAGMEGALPSVLGGLVSAPVIAVPTSVGYGAAFGGVAALLGMLTSCAAGVSVVNIDNGFGAAYTATLIQRLADRASDVR